MKFEEFLMQQARLEAGTTEDVLTSFLPLMREVLEAHRAGTVAPLVGLQDLQVEQSRIWFEEAKRQPIRRNPSALARLEQASRASVEVLSESRITLNVGEGYSAIQTVDIAARGEPITRAIFLPGYISWEHEIEHHDPLTDVFSLGLILASLACGLNLNELEDLQSFVAHRRNLFAINSQLHPTLAQVILHMTELDRYRREPDLSTLLRVLENYRDQTVEFDIDLARLPGLKTRDPKTKREIILTRLRDRLFDLSRRNSLLHFRATMSTVNLTQASIPLLLDIRKIRPEQILVWNDAVRQQLVDGMSISLNKYLNFAEAIYLPSQLEKTIAESRRDQQEYGFAQLRLVICFLSWANLKIKPAEGYVSPLVLLPVRLTKTKGIRDAFHLEAVSSEAEVNPVVRHQFRELYNIDLPETVELSTNGVESLLDYLKACVQSSEPAVSITRIDKPRIDLIHEKAKRRVDQYRRTAHISGRGIRTFQDIDYSYDPANYHPLGVKLFAAKIRQPSSHLRSIIEEHPRTRQFMASDNAADTVVKERTFYHVREIAEENPYLWNFDLCNLTLANFRYRRMSLVRDYEALLAADQSNPSFESTFSVAPRPVGREIPAVPPNNERFDVVPCDPTQATAIAEARTGKSYIIQGPPGTGKSQTITNLIADYVARGQRVLFVCEKRAAIDVVFARLRQTGLGQLCCLIHDSQTDKKDFILDLKQTYELFLEAKTTKSLASKARDDMLKQLEQHLSPLERFERAMESTVASAGIPTRQLLDRCIELRHICPSLTSQESEGLPLYHQSWAERDRLSNIDSLMRDFAPSGILAHHPLRYLSPGLVDAERPMQTVAEAAQQALALLDQAAAQLERSGVPNKLWNSLQRMQELLEYAELASVVAHGGNLALVNVTSQTARQFDAALVEIRKAQATLDDARKQTTLWREKLSEMELTTALQQSKRWEQSYTAWLSPDWWRLRRTLNTSYDFRAHRVRPSWTQILTALSHEYELKRNFENASQSIMAKFRLQRDLIQFETDVSALREWLRSAPNWLRQFHEHLLDSRVPDEQLDKLLSARGTVAKLSAELKELLIDYERLTIKQLRETLVGVAASVDDVPQALPVIAELGRLPAALATALRERPWSLEQIESASASHTWETIARTDQSITRFDGRARRLHVDQLETVYDGWLRANAAEICSRVQHRFLANIHLSNSPAAQLDPAQAEFKKAYNQGRKTLEHEFGKTMRYRSIRDLVDGHAGLVVRDLKPVWLMSPLSVSDTLPLVADFVDVVIFDEASQVPLEESVPCLFRGPQVIVVGDEMQLPPTDFFATKRQDDELEATNDDGPELLRFDLASDSLLNHASKNLISTMLGWHYRSRSESLISFSNWAFYDGRLLTVPDEHLMPTSADAKEQSSASELALSRPLSFHYLPSGIYDKRRNRVEADYIAQLVRDIFLRDHELTIAIVAFSEAQQDEIEMALDRLAQQDDAFRQTYEQQLVREADGQFVGLLVKNLENIQGDERDVVILSVCYGVPPSGKMLMNFGPINQSGGEKRLNVAFSRAKRHMAVVSSIKHSAITNDYNVGANCLKQYLHYAEAMSLGDLRSASHVLNGISRWRDAIESESDAADPLSAEVAARLRERGFIVDVGIGQSHFRVDLAIRRPNESAYRLGISIDTLESYEQSEPLERDVMRPRLLRACGWQVTHVLAKDWIDAPDKELRRIIRLLQDEESSQEVS